MRPGIAAPIESEDKGIRKRVRGSYALIREKRKQQGGSADSGPAAFVSDEMNPRRGGNYLNDRLVWRIRWFWVLMCPRKFVFGTVTA